MPARLWPEAREPRRKKWPRWKPRESEWSRVLQTLATPCIPRFSNLVAICGRVLLPRGEGGRRPDEGAIFIFDELCTPHPAFGHPLPKERDRSENRPQYPSVRETVCS